MKVAAIVAAAGKGERLKSKVRKPFVALGKEPILLHALRVLDNSNLIGEIIVVAHQADLPKARLLIKKAKLKKRTKQQTLVLRMLLEKKQILSRRKRLASHLL